MSLAGFKATNHPQQTAKRGAEDRTDDRGTKREFIDMLETRFGGPFTLDAAAAPHNAKAPRYYTREDNGLRQPWTGRVWCNPPYSNLSAWVSKAWGAWVNDNPELIVMLLPANRPEQGWWQDFVEPYRDGRAQYGSALGRDCNFRVEFLRGRMRFDMPPEWVTPEKGDRPPFGCCLLIWSQP